MTQSRAVSAFGDALREADPRESCSREPGSRDAPPIRSLTDRVLLEDLPAEIGGRPVLGISSMSLLALPFEPRGSFVVTGPSGSGRSASLASLAGSLRRWNAATQLYFLTPRRASELLALVDWTEAAAGPDAIALLAARLLTHLHAEQDEQDEQDDEPHDRTRRGPTAVVIERVDDLAGTVAEPLLSSLTKACLDDGHFVVAEGDASFFSSNFGLPGLLKTSRSGLALQPDGIEGQTVFRSTFPLLNWAELPEGRGFLVQRGRPELLQVALAEEPDPGSADRDRDLIPFPGECSPSTLLAGAPSFAGSGVGTSAERKRT